MDHIYTYMKQMENICMSSKKYQMKEKLMWGRLFFYCYRSIILLIRAPSMFTVLLQDRSIKVMNITQL